MNVFDILGPVMIGPSSSHTAGACSIALLAQQMADSPVKDVEFVLYNSFAQTYKGHGTDLALLGGVMGFSTDDKRIPKAFSIAEERGISYRFIEQPKIRTFIQTLWISILPARADTLILSAVNLWAAEKMRISRINHIDVDFSGEYSTLIIIHYDRPGVLAHITGCLSEKNVNIAFMKLFRETKGDIAYSIIEFDGTLPDDAEDQISLNPYVQDVIFIPIQRRI